MATNEAVQKDLIIDISAEGIEDVKRAFVAVSSALKEVRKVGSAGLADVNGRFKDVGRSAATSLRTLQSIAGFITSISTSAAALGFGAAIVSAGSLYAIIKNIKAVTVEAIEEEKRLSSSAAIFGIQGRDGNSAAKVAGAIEYAFEKSGAAKRDEVKDIITPLIDNVQNALKGDDGALQALGNLGLTLDDIATANGEMKDVDSILKAIMRRTSGIDPKAVLASLVPIFGDSDSQKVAILLKAGLKEYEANQKEYLRIRDLTEDDEAISRRVVSALALQGIAYENLGTSIKRGFGDPMAEVALLTTQFIDGIRGDLEDYAKIFGDSYERIMKRVFAEAERFTDVLRGASGEITDGPLEGWLMSVESILGSVLGTAVDFVDYLANGSTENTFVLKVVEIFGAVKSIVLEAIEAGKKFAALFMEHIWPGLSSIAEFLGADSDFEKVGIIAALVLFRGTIVNVVRLGASLVGLFSNVLKAAGAAVGPITALATQLGAVEAIGGRLKAAKGIAGRAGLFGAAAVAGAATGSAIVSDEKRAKDYGKFITDLENMLLAQGKTEEEIAAYIQVAVQKFKEQNGSSRLLQLQSVLDNIPGVNSLMTSEKDLLDMIEAKVNEGLASPNRQAVVDARAQAEADFAAYTGDPQTLTIGGVVFTDKVASDLNDGLQDMTKRVNLDVQIDAALEQLSGRVMNPMITAEGNRYFGMSQDVEGMSRSSLTPIKLYINNEQLAEVYVTEDAYAQIERNKQVSRRAR